MNTTGDTRTTWLLGLALCGLMIAYVALPAARSVALVWLCLSLLGGLFSLQPRQVMALCGLAIGLLTLGMLGSWRLDGTHFDPLHDGLAGLMTGLMLPAVGWVVHQFSLRRQRLAGQQEALADTLARTQQLSTKDPLTGLFNQRHMIDWMSQEAKRSQRAGSPLSVAVMNLDHFRQFNKQHGHEAGDQLLCAWAQSAQAVFRQTDVIARWQGDEFIVLFADSTTEQAFLGLTRLRAAMSESSRQGMPSGQAVTLSAGLVAWQPGDTAEAVIERARTALHQAKVQGRDQVLIAPSVAS